MKGTGPQRPLQGIRVIDLTRVVSGPTCTRLLADLGADVIKVEDPHGDVGRRVPPFVNDVSAYFAHLNAGKKSVVIDLRHEEGPAAVRRLVARSEVLVENFRPGVLARHGLDAKTLLVDFPQLIYCSISGYGQRGSWSNRRAYAPMVQAEVGLLDTVAVRRGEPVRQEAQSHADIYAGLLAANAVLAALVQRASTGCGQHLDVSLADACLYTNEWAAPELAGDSQRISGPAASPVFEVADGTKVATTGNPAVTLPDWAKALGVPEVLDDERFRSVRSRLSHREDLIELLSGLIARVPTFEALDRLLEPFALVAGRVRSLEETLATPWALENDVIAETPDGVRVPRAPWRASGAAIGTDASKPIPPLGSDTASVLSAVAGYSREDAERMAHQMGTRA